MIRILILLGVIISFSGNVISQVAVMGGANCSYVRNNNLLKNQVPFIAFHTGLSLKLYPFKKDSSVSVQSELMFSQKGYMQKLDKNYTVHFNDISWTILANFPLIANLVVNSGIEFSELISTNVTEGTQTYNHSDVGLVLGVSCFEKHRVSFYTRAVYGLFPMLDYYSIDKLGNFTGEIHDLKNMCISAGIKINLYNEKIRLYK